MFADTMITARRTHRAWLNILILAAAGIVGLTAPAAADTIRCRVVDYGDDFAHLRLDQWLLSGNLLTTNLDLDADGTVDDSVTYSLFDLSTPYLGYWRARGTYHPRCDWEATNMKIYGGRVNFMLDYQGTWMLEGGGPNMDHSMGADDINFMIDSPGGNSKPLRGYGLWLWKKTDFQNGGAAYPVSFDAQSRIGLYETRHWNTPSLEGRFVVGDGDQLYMAEQIFKGGYTNHLLSPTTIRWAVYNPTAPYNIVFNPDTAVYATRTFTNVTYAGYYLISASNNEYRVYANNTGAKLGAFEVEATVTKPVSVSDHLAMTLIPARALTIGGQPVTVPSFHISQTEVPYATYQTVYRWSFSDLWLLEPGYIYDRAGDMGSMRKGAATHTPDEPAAGMTWLDAVAWCNALSEKESRQPVYYINAACTAVFRNPRERRFSDAVNALSNNNLKVFVKWSADGYRLPTPAEWIAAYGTPTSPAGPTTQTMRVDSGSTNQFGLYHMLGNVWEYCWDYPGAYTNALPPKHTLLGADINYPGSPETNGASPYGDAPIRGAYNIGLRVVRNATNLVPPLISVNATNGVDLAGAFFGVPSWTFSTNYRTAGIAPITNATPVLDMVAIASGSFLRTVYTVGTNTTYISSLYCSRYEIPFEKWNHVYHWALAKGYSFSYDGDMGSMYRASSNHVRAANEPVTRVSWFDCLLWCNALSEMEGRKPCYYTNGGRTNVLRSSHVLQKQQKHTSDNWPTASPPAPTNWVDWSADGYRLPTLCEFEYVARAGTQTTYPWGTSASQITNYCWTAENTSGKARPVGTKLPNAWGMYDMLGNVLEWLWSGADAPLEQVRNPKGTAALNRAYTHGGGFIFPLSSAGYGDFYNMITGKEQTSYHLAYPEIGFRVVRCAAGTHPADGEEAPLDVIFVETAGKPKPEPLQNATYRGNQARTGVFETRGAAVFGGVRWRFRTGGAVKSSPIAVDGTVFVGSDDTNIYAIDLATGSERWRYKTGGAVRSSPTIAGNNVFIGCNDGRIYSLRTANGQTNWATSPGTLIGCAPSIGYSAVFAWVEGYLQGLKAFNVATGAEVARYYNVSVNVDSTLKDRTPCLVDDTLVYTKLINVRNGSQTNFGLYGMGGSNGDPAANGYAVVTNATLGGMVHGGGQNTASAADFRTGTHAWDIWFNEADGWASRGLHMIRTAPAVWSNRVCYGSDDGTLYVRNPASGAHVWSNFCGAAVQSAPSISSQDAMVYVGCNNGRLYAFDLINGTQKWSFKTGGAIVSSPSACDGAVLIGSDDGSVYCLDGVTNLAIVNHDNNIIVPEGGTNAFGLSLTLAPPTTVTVSVTRVLGSTTISVTGATTFVFTPATWNVPQPVLLYATSNAVTDSAMFRCSAPGLAERHVTVGDSIIPEPHMLLTAVLGSMVIRAVVSR
jgi:formylglycine-generating enzyme required for sulfatase activity/outer membrane protein assembly factor BamB